VLYRMVTGRPPLHLEAYWADLLDSSGNLLGAKEMDFKKLLCGTQPLALTHFFAATPAWDVTVMSGLSALVDAWLAPSPARRTEAGWEGPVQQAALNALRTVIAELRASYPEALTAEVGAGRIEAPPRRAVPIPPAVPSDGTPPYASDETTRNRRAESPEGQIGAQP
jgi:hypothetical protein